MCFAMLLQLIVLLGVVGSSFALDSREFYLPNDVQSNVRETINLPTQCLKLSANDSYLPFVVQINDECIYSSFSFHSNGRQYDGFRLWMSSNGTRRECSYTNGYYKIVYKLSNDLEIVQHFFFDCQFSYIDQMLNTTKIYLGSSIKTTGCQNNFKSGDFEAYALAYGSAQVDLKIRSGSCDISSQKSTSKYIQFNYDSQYEIKSFRFGVNGEPTSANLLPTLFLSLIALYLFH
ncbi:hypothetical protein M3Y95_00369600 [Aphelenchoides besseyi]|nr:hypothetical protein M3Y95_00369600 [Aphelenchoides besseyi]